MAKRGCHAELSTTQVYIQVSILKLKEIHAATHPSARLRREDAGGDEAGDGTGELLEENLEKGVNLGDEDLEDADPPTE